MRQNYFPVNSTEECEEMIMNDLCVERKREEEKILKDFSPPFIHTKRIDGLICTKKNS